MAGVEPFKSSRRYGWRLRNEAGVIEFSRSAAFPTEAAALANARGCGHLVLSSLPPDGLLVDVGRVR